MRTRGFCGFVAAAGVDLVLEASFGRRSFGFAAVVVPVVLVVLVVFVGGFLGGLRGPAGAAARPWDSFALVVVFVRTILGTLCVLAAELGRCWRDGMASHCVAGGGKGKKKEACPLLCFNDGVEVNRVLESRSGWLPH